MAQIETRLSQKVNKETGRAEILLRLYQGKKYDLYAKTSLFVMPRYFEYYINKSKTAKNGVSVPDKTITVTREEATKKGYILYDRGELVVNARIIRKTNFPHFPKRSVKNQAKILKRSGCPKINHTTSNNKECSQFDCILCV